MLGWCWRAPIRVPERCPSKPRPWLAAGVFVAVFVVVLSTASPPRLRVRDRRRLSLVPVQLGGYP